MGHTHRYQLCFKKKKRVPVLSLASRKLVWIRQSGRAGIRGVTRPLTMGSSTRQKMGKNPRRAISTTRMLRSGDRIDDRPAPIAMGRAEPIGTTSGKAECYPARHKKRGVTRGLPRRSPILVLLSPKHA